MILKKEIKKVIDHLPDSILEEVCNILKTISESPIKKKSKLTIHEFNGNLDKANIRKWQMNKSVVDTHIMVYIKDRSFIFHQASISAIQNRKNSFRIDQQ